MTTTTPDALTSTDAEKLTELRELVAGRRHLIDGELVRSQSAFPVTAPWCDELLGHAPEASAADVEAAVAAALRAQPAWAADESRRRETLHAIADVVDESVDLLAQVVAAENGKSLAAATGEVRASAAHLRYHADLDIPDEVLVDDDVQRVVVVHDPIGVVASITPWNAPLMMLVNKVAAALRAGNTVLAKSSPFTPFSSLVFAELVHGLLPNGVLNVFAGGDEAGAAATRADGVGMVAFTGSVAAGQAIMAQAAPGLRRLQLELGGNDAAIVLPDADVDTIAPDLYRGAFALSGQICAAVKRLYVHVSLFEPLVEALSAISAGARLGSPFDPETTMGPITTRPQFERVLGLIEDARRTGATFHSGGRTLDRPGFFIEPTIVTGVAHGHPLVDEEQFGPVLPILPYSTVDEAVAAANSTPFGLGGSVWTDDLDEGWRVARRLRSGGAWVNRHPHVGADVPFGGVGLSGIGREGGPRSFEDFTHAKTISLLK